MGKYLCRREQDGEEERAGWGGGGGESGREEAEVPDEINQKILLVERERATNRVWGRWVLIE